MNKLIVFVFILGFSFPVISQEKNVIHLTWKDVVDISKEKNLSLKSKILEYEAQDWQEWKALSYFLPTFTYQGVATNNLELPVFVFMGQKFIVGTKYSFQHSLELSLPLFTGGTRWFNYNIQKNLRKSLSEELKGKEEEVVLQSLQAYYGVMLSTSMLKTAEEAFNLAKANLEQVEKFYEAGTATGLDLQRAKAQYASTQPAVERAKSGFILANQQLKFLLNIPSSDSLVVDDSLVVKDFLDELAFSNLDDFKAFSEKNRADIKALDYQVKATSEGEKATLGKFAPTIAISANVLHQAQIEYASVSANDYIRSKGVSLALIWPLFEGGRKLIDYQESKLRTEQMKLLYEQADKKRVLDVEQSYFTFIENSKNKESLEEAMNMAKESLRLSNLLYVEGMSTQLDVLNAQFAYSQNKVEHLKGIYDFNISQLNLLYSTGLLKNIWK
jgi:outer membrane protein TolC